MRLYKVSKRDFTNNFRGKVMFHGWFPANHVLVSHLNVKSGDIVTDKYRSAYSRISERL